MSMVARAIFPPPTLHVDFDENGAAQRPKLVVRSITSFPYPPDDDPSTLLGTEDYLGRGGGMLFVSHAGAGKSSFIMQACMSWALGQPWLGLRCARPLRSLIIQAEDSDRYIGKVQASFAHANKLSADDIKRVGENCRIVRLKGVSGVAFFERLRQLATDFEPDLVIINPLYLYADGDIGRSEFTQPFLVGLDGVNRDEKWAYILVHHTGKPTPKGTNGRRANVEDWESIYMGFGSSYLANWPRCTALLEPVPDQRGRYVIKLGKGGLNAGITEPSVTGNHQVPVTRIHLKHSEAKMDVGGRLRPVYYWEADEKPKEESAAARGGRPKKYSFADFLKYIPASAQRAITRQAIYNFVRETSPIKETAFRELLNEAVDDGMVVRVTPAGGGFAYHLNVSQATQLPTPLG